MMKQLALVVGSFAALGMISPTAPLPSLAQADVREPVCMAGVANDTGQSFTIIVHSDRASALRSRGFVVEPCEGKDAEIAAYRSEVCALARSTPEQVKQGLIANYGIGPDEMCQLAREIGS